MTLSELVLNANNKTDKYDLGYITEFYEKLFSPRQSSATNLLEIGIYDGESIKLWKSFFSNATIHCADIYDCPSINGVERVKPYYGNAYDVNYVNSFPKEYFDIIIDDGPHTFDSMVFFLLHYVDLLKSGGVLILEDIIDRTWTPKLLSLLDKNVGKISVYDMRFKQRTVDLYEQWKYGLDVIVLEKY